MTNDLIELTKVGLSEIYLNEVDAPNSQYADIFQVVDSKLSVEQELRMAGFGGIPVWNADGGKILYDKPLSGSRILFTHTDYALGWVVSHKMLREDLYNKVGKDLVTGAGLSTKHSIEQDSMNVINLGFLVNGPDGVPLFSASHPMLNSSLQSNLLAAAALTKGTLATAIAAIKRSVNDQNQPIVYDLDALLVGPELGFTAKEILTLATRPVENLAKNENVGGVMPNVYQGVIPRILESPYITDTNGYVILAIKKQRHLKFWWRERPWYDADKDFETKGVANSVAYAYSVGYPHWGGVWGSEGA